MRKTSETNVSLSLLLDGSGRAEVECGIPFFEHMLTLFCSHGCFDIVLKAEGDLEVDAHHLVEDIGLVLGQAFDDALGDRAGIKRYGSIILPMDEALVLVAADFSGRPYLVFDLPLAVSRARCTLHVKLLNGRNTHHKIEALFKALGRALDEASRGDERVRGIPSTKGIL